MGLCLPPRDGVTVSVSFVHCFAAACMIQHVSVRAITFESLGTHMVIYLVSRHPPLRVVDGVTMSAIPSLPVPFTSLVARLIYIGFCGLCTYLLASSLAFEARLLCRKSPYINPASRPPSTACGCISPLETSASVIPLLDRYHCTSRPPSGICPLAVRYSHIRREPLWV